METYQLKITLKSDTLFGRGDGVAGWVDQEVQHDELGCPFWNGRALKGVLVNECADILAANQDVKKWQEAAQRLFGEPGNMSTSPSLCYLTIGSAVLPQNLVDRLNQQLEQQLQRVAEENKNDINTCRIRQKSVRSSFREQVLSSLTTTRNQTAISENGVAQPHSLRVQRVILHNAVFFARLQFQQKPYPEDLALLAACTKALRRAGSHRNRGEGKLAARLLDHEGSDITEQYYKVFWPEAK